MLQIISGKFFKSDDRHIHDGKGILYSNYSWGAPIETCVATLEPVDHFREVSSYVLVYVNQIEKGGIIVRKGDSEILEQFKLLATFGFRAYFAPFRDEIAQICRKSSLGGTDQYVPSQFIPRFFEGGTHGNNQEVTCFIELVKKVIGLKRQIYNAVMSAFKTIRDALLASNYNLDLSYSMLVYCLESLSQKFDNYSATWKDYDEALRNPLDEVLKTIDQKKAELIQSLLLSSENFLLCRRFIGFVSDHVGDSFFQEEAVNIEMALRKSHLKRALRNAYIMRSKFVHQLTPILHQLRIPVIAKGDIFSWDGEPYLTLSGLLRLTLHVINNFIWRCESIEKEDFDWRQEIPGVVTMKLAPQYWVLNVDGFEPMEAATRFSGFLEQVYASYSRKESISDLRTLMKAFEDKIPKAKQTHKITLLAMYWLYNAIIKEDAKQPDWEKFLDQYSNEIMTCSMEMMIVRVLLFQDLPWFVEQCIDVFKDFNEKRFGKKSLEIPVMIEVALLVTIANHASRENRYQDRTWLLKTAIYEASGYIEIQRLLSDNLGTKDELRVHNILGIQPAGQEPLGS